MTGYTISRSFMR